MMGCLWLYSSPHMYVFIPSECIHVYMMQWNSEKWDCCHCFSDIRCFSSVLFSAKTTFSLFGWYQAHIIFFNFKKTWTGPFSVLLPFIINAKAYMRLLSPKQEAVAKRNCEIPWLSLLHLLLPPSSFFPFFFLESILKECLKNWDFSFLTCSCRASTQYHPHNHFINPW